LAIYSKRISIIAAFARASIGFEAGSVCVGKKAPYGKKTYIAAKIVRVIIRPIISLGIVKLY